MQTGERQAACMRVRYLQAVLKQDVTFFDTDAVRTGDVMSVISSDTLLVQDAVSEKVMSFTGCLLKYN
jgi:ATP-binding cassette subfamily B (MDR/TAP) protein 1